MPTLRAGDVELYYEDRGSRFPPLPAPSSDVLQVRIPRSTLRVIEGAGHLFFLERPEETLATVQAFLDGPA